MARSQADAGVPMDSVRIPFSHSILLSAPSGVKHKALPQIRALGLAAESVYSLLFRFDYSCCRGKRTWGKIRLRLSEGVSDP